MVKEEKEIVPEEAPKSKEDAPHVAFRALIASYKLKNPEKYESKRLSFEAKLSKKLAFGLKQDGSPDGSIVIVE